MTRRMVVTLVVLSAIVVIAFFVFFPNMKVAPVLPDVAEVRTITAYLKNGAVKDIVGGGPVPEFPVPPERFATVLNAITPAKREEAWFTRLGPIGHLTITTKSEETFDIEFFDGGVNPLCFTVNGVSAMREGTFQSFNPKGTGNWHADEGILYLAVIAEIYRVHFQKRNSDRLDMDIDKLKISRGEKPPPYQ
jgi:hypothetical protein